MRTVTLLHRDEVPEELGARLQALSEAVYPPDEDADWPGHAIEWAGSTWRVLVECDRRLVSHIGVLVREATLNGADVRIGGIGGVMTHPDSRRGRHAAAGILSAMSFLREDAGCDFGLLVCDDGLIPYYEALGWRVFDGDLLTLQRGKTVPFTFNRVMVMNLLEAGPERGTIDLHGPPW